jgi:hypothetical protein
VPYEIRVANAHQLNFGSQSENGITFQTYSIDDGDFTFRLTLGIIPDPDLILGVLYHEATIARGWIINSSHDWVFGTIILSEVSPSLVVLTVTSTAGALSIAVRFAD